MVGESLRLNTPNEMQCSMFCGGRRCKYESDSRYDGSRNVEIGECCEKRRDKLLIIILVQLEAV